MIKLSTKGRYGVRLMIDLAENFGKAPVTLKDISRRQEISEKYLWSIVLPLKNAGLVGSMRGAHGGYVLTRSPDKINLGDIVCILEGPVQLVDCVVTPSVCKRTPTCVARDVWKDASDEIMQILSRYTLDKILIKQTHKLAALNSA